MKKKNIYPEGIFFFNEYFLCSFESERPNGSIKSRYTYIPFMYDWIFIPLCIHRTEYSIEYTLQHLT